MLALDVHLAGRSLAMAGSLALCLAITTGCTTAPTDRVAAAAPSAAATPAGPIAAVPMRLPAGVAIRVHARDLQIGQIDLQRGAQHWAGRAVQVDAERVDLQFDTAVPAGDARLLVAFSGSISERETYGLFRQRDAGQWAAFTQFEATGARRVFPLFDEPGWKVPWTLSVTVPDGLMAVSNMPVAREAPAGPGWRRVDFEPTPPLPSYLLALGVGRFDVLDAGTVGRNRVPMRFIVPPGQRADAAFAAGITGRIVDRLEAWFGTPYPYAKLDSLVQPVTSGYGAMEHPGLITYAARLLLAAPGEQTPPFERRYATIAAHELAHQWFGNLVTMAWWDDLWLNESFASWMADKIASEVQPDWPWQATLQRARSEAMRSDRLASARRIEQPVLQDDDIGNLFSPITYQKGQAVLGMFEAWAGPTAFRDGVRGYLQRHAWGNATSTDFFRAIAATDNALPAAVRSFTRQGGIPRLQVRLLCEGGPPRLQLAQSRLLPIGARADAPQAWQLPLRVRTPAGSARLLMTTPEAVLPLPDTRCPAWVQANADGSGYWRAVYAGDGLQRLAAAPAQSVAEWLVLLDDGIGLHEAGDITNRQALALVRSGAAQPPGEVVLAAAALLRHLQPLAEAGDGRSRTALQKTWQSAFGERARRLGWLPGPGDSADDRLLRPRLVPLVAQWGDDAVLRRQALGLARAWLADHASLPADLRGAVLSAAARADGPDAGAPLFDALLAALRASASRTERSDLYAALGQFRQPALAARAHALLLDAQVDLREALWPLLGSAVDDGPGRAAALDFVLREQAVLAARLTEQGLAFLPQFFRGACSDADARRLDTGLQAAAAGVAGGRQTLARTLESVQLCAAWRAQLGSSFD